MDGQAARFEDVQQQNANDDHHEARPPRAFVANALLGLNGGQQPVGPEGNPDDEDGDRPYQRRRAPASAPPKRNPSTHSTSAAISTNHRTCTAKPSPSKMARIRSSTMSATIRASFSVHKRSRSRATQIDHSKREACRSRARVQLSISLSDSLHPRLLTSCSGRRSSPSRACRPG